MVESKSATKAIAEFKETEWRDSDNPCFTDATLRVGRKRGHINVPVDCISCDRDGKVSSLYTSDGCLNILALICEGAWELVIEINHDNLFCTPYCKRVYNEMKHLVKAL